MQRLIVFDLDGVLLDTRVANYEAFRYGLEGAGCALPEPYQVASLIGIPALDMLERLGCPAQHCQEIYKRYVQPHYLENLEHLAQPFPRARQVLETLREMGFRMAACTSGDSATQERALKATGLRDFIEHMQTPDSSRHRKPDPRYLGEVVQACGPQHRVIHVEDSEVGLRMGREYGATTVFAEYGFGSHGAERPDHRMAALVELVDLARGWAPPRQEMRRPA